MQSERPSYTLEDLSAKTGFDIRVIRSFIEQGLLRGPTSLGRYARYSDLHLARLFAIKALKEKRRLKLSDIRQTLLCMTDSEILALAETAREPEANQQSSALDYIRSLNLQIFNSPAPKTVPATGKHTPGASLESNSDSFDLYFSNEQGNSTSSRQLPASETWHRFQITPDVELSVRGIQTEVQMERMKNIANRLREFLIGGQNE